MLTHDYTAICEFARPEPGGKFTLIGLFLNGIGTPMLPFVIPVLTFFQVMKSDTAGQYKLKATLRQLSNGHLLASAQGALPVGQPGLVVAPLALANLKFNAWDSYTFSVEVEGQSDPFVTEFQVAQVPFPQFMPGSPGR